MQTVIVPIDFSQTSINAAEYAIQLLTGHYGVNMILYHIYEREGQEDEANEKLKELNEQLRDKGIVKTELMARKGEFIDELDKLARHRDADLIIMGITGRSTIGQTLIGSNTLKMVERNACPVLIVPPDCKYREVKNVLITSDFHQVKDTIPSVPIKKVLKPFRPSLHVMNVDSSHYVSITEEYQKEKDDFISLFKEFKPEFYFLGLEDVNEAIHQFAQDKNIDLMITIRKQQGLFSRLFSKSQTKKLAYETTIPLLALSE